MIGTQDMNRSRGLERVVGKRSSGIEAEPVRNCGASGSENPGMSNVKNG